MNDQKNSIKVINGHLMSDYLSDNHSSRQTLYLIIEPDVRHLECS